MADFFDTNVLVYAFDNDEPGKQARARELIRNSPDAIISTQVLLEWYSVVTRKFSPPTPPAAASSRPSFSFFSCSMMSAMSPAHSGSSNAVKRKHALRSMGPSSASAVAQHGRGPRR